MLERQQIEFIDGEMWNVEIDAKYLWNHRRQLYYLSSVGRVFLLRIECIFMFFVYVNCICFLFSFLL